MASDPPEGEVDTCTLKQIELYLMLTNQTQQLYPHILGISCHMPLSLDGSDLVIAWHAPDILIRSESPFWPPIGGVTHTSLVVITYLIADHDLDHILVAIVLLIAGHIVCSTQP